MASDYGDESGEKMLDGFTRLGERMGMGVVYRRSDKLQRAFDNVKGQTTALDAEGAGEQARVEWARLDMEEFRQAGGYEDLKRSVEDRLRAHGIEPAWFEDAENQREYLIFRVTDAQEVWDCFGELSREQAHEPDAENRGRRDDRPLEVRAQQAREASEALEAERPDSRARGREPRFQEPRSK